MSFLLSYEKAGNTMVKKLNGMREEYETNDRPQEHVFELFTDSDWAGNAPTRKSTSSTILCLNSVIVHSSCERYMSVPRPLLKHFLRSGE